MATIPMPTPQLPALALGISVAVILGGIAPRALALPPPEDTPEEVLRPEIILEARSPLTGESMTPAAYAELQHELQQAEITTAAPILRQTLFLLQLRRALRPLVPLLP